MAKSGLYVVNSLQLCEMETSKDVLRVKSFVRGYHEYKEIWEPKIGQEAMLMREPQNKWDSNAVTVVGGVTSDTMARKQEFSNTEPLKHPNEFDPGHEEVVGHLPKLMALHVTKFLKRPTNSGKVAVTGKRVNRGAGYGLELPCEYLFYGDKFSCEWPKKKLAKEGFHCE